jgi:hypothetical protein
LQATDCHPDEVAEQAVAGTSTGRFTHPQRGCRPGRAAGQGDRPGNITDTDIVIDGELVKRLGAEGVRLARARTMGAALDGDEFPC